MGGREGVWGGRLEEEAGEGRRPIPRTGRDQARPELPPFSGTHSERTGRAAGPEAESLRRQWGAGGQAVDGETWVHTFVWTLQAQGVPAEPQFPSFVTRKPHPLSGRLGSEEATPGSPGGGSAPALPPPDRLWEPPCHQPEWAQLAGCWRGQRALPAGGGSQKGGGGGWGGDAHRWVPGAWPGTDVLNE